MLFKLQFLCTGKAVSALSKIISLAVELLKNEHTVIETLNRFHVLSITKEEIEVRLNSYCHIIAEKEVKSIITTCFRQSIIQC